MYRNNRILKKILGKKQYKELMRYTKERVKEIYGRQFILITKKLIYVNNSAVLIIALLKTRKYENNRFFRKLYVNQLQNNQYLTEKNIDNFIKKYDRYIKLVENKINIM